MRDWLVDFETFITHHQILQTLSSLSFFITIDLYKIKNSFHQDEGHECEVKAENSEAGESSEPEEQDATDLVFNVAFFLPS